MTPTSRWMRAPAESPVQVRLADLPRGSGDWPGYAYVHRQIQDACMVMSCTYHVMHSREYVNTQAVLQCGHERTMRDEMERLRRRGFC